VIFTRHNPSTMIRAGASMNNDERVTGKARGGFASVPSLKHRL
jgi:hypothetical protein